MHHKTILLSITLLSIAGLPAQDERRPDPAPRDSKQGQFQARDQIALSDVLGAKVRLKPSTAERNEAAAEQRAPDRPNGSIDDLIIDCQSGKATWAILSVGGLLGVGAKEVAVPASSLMATRTGDKAPVYDLSATEAELKALRAFDKELAEKGDLDAALRNAESSWNAVRPDGTDGRPIEASGKRRETGVDGEATGDLQPRAILGTKLEGMSVCCTSDGKDKDFGKVESACIDLPHNVVTYLVIGHGGVVGIGKSEYLVPLRATRTVTVGDDRKPTLVLVKTAAEMESAPKYAKPDTGFVTDENARSSCEFFGVEHGKSGESRGDKTDKSHDKSYDKGKRR